MIRFIVNRVRELREANASLGEIATKAIRYFFTVYFPSFLNSIRLKVFLSILRFKKKSVLQKGSAAEGILVMPKNGLGDNMVAINFYRTLSEWSEHSGEKIVFICTSFTRKIIEENICIRNFEYILLPIEETIPFSKFKKAFYEIVGKKFRYVIVLNSYGVINKNIICGAADADKKLFTSELLRQSRIDELSNIYDTIIPLDYDCFYIRHYGKLLKEIGIDGYSNTIGRIVCKKEGRLSERYVLFCPHGSSRDKSLDVEFCEKIIEDISRLYNGHVYISVPNDGETYSNEIKKIVEQYENVSLLGETTFDEFASIVSQSDVVIGNDSGPIHLAASLGVSSLCFAGYYQSGYFHPYDVDSLCEDDNVPVCIMQKRPLCADCAEKGTYLGNKDCRKRTIEEKKSCLCLANYDEIRELFISEFVKTINGKD